MYVTSLFRVLPQSVSMEAIKEVETLPRAAPANVSRVTTEEHYEIQTQQRFSQQVRHISPYGCHGGIARAHFFGRILQSSDPPVPVNTSVLLFNFKERLITIVYTIWGFSCVSAEDSEVKNAERITFLSTVLYHVCGHGGKGHMKVGFRNDKLMIRYPGQGD